MNDLSYRQVIAVLRRAEAKLKKYGWVQGEYGSMMGGYCASAAINESTQDTELRWVARSFLRHNAAPSWPSIIKWNDAPERTEEEVIQAFDLTIKGLKKEDEK